MTDLSDKNNLCVNKDCQVVACCIDSSVQLTNIKDLAVSEAEKMISKCRGVMLPFQLIRFAFIPPLKILYPRQRGR